MTTKEKLNLCNEHLSDELIIEIFISKTKKGTYKLNTVASKHLKEYKNVENFLLCKYDDSESIQETLYRMFYKLEKRPVCAECGKPVKYKNFFFGYNKFCCAHCARVNTDTINKKRQTTLEKYGDETFNNREKAKHTCIDRYDDENYRNPDKNKQTCQERYGVNNATQLIEIKNKIKQTKLERYGDENYTNLEKCKQTCQERYGVNNIAQFIETQNKVKQTKLERYGDENYNNHEKAKQTCLEKYGADNVMKLQEFKSRFQQAMINKYGVYAAMLSEELKEKQRESCDVSFGYRFYAQTPECKEANSKRMKSKETQDRILAIKKKNNSFHTSKIEKEFKEYLDKTFFDDYIHQYKSDLYPFNCDFYIKSLDLYIEIQADFRHGFHPFDDESEEDIKRLNKLRELERIKLEDEHQKRTDYTNAIVTWTYRDPVKRQTAKENNINYLEIFSNDINECIDQFNEYISNLHNY